MTSRSKLANVNIRQVNGTVSGRREFSRCRVYQVNTSRQRRKADDRRVEEEAAEQSRRQLIEVDSRGRCVAMRSIDEKISRMSRSMGFLVVNQGVRVDWM